MALVVPVSPMLLSSAKQPFDDSDYLFEWKVDGVRCVAHIDEGKVRLFSRHGLECTAAFPELQTLPEHLLGSSAVLDGELCVMINGKPDLESVMERYMAVKSVRRKAKEMPASLVLWDIIEHDGKEMSAQPLIDRKKVLRETVIPGGSVVIIDSIEGQGTALFQAVSQVGLEGIVAKKKSSRYRMGVRSKDWIKVKDWKDIVCVVMGYRLGDEPAFYLGQLVDGNVKYVGTVEHGMKYHHRQALATVGRDIETRRDTKAVWLEPKLWCKVRHVGKTKSGFLRDAYFEGFLTEEIA